MEKQQPDQAPHTPNRGLGRLARPADSFGLVLLLIILDYIALAAVNDNAWGRVVIVALLGATLLFALRTSRARRIWQLLAIIYLVTSTLFDAGQRSGARREGLQPADRACWRIIAHRHAVRHFAPHRLTPSGDDGDGAWSGLCLPVDRILVHLHLLDDWLLGAAPFFEGVAHATANEYLFFSYTTLTTVGYGNLIPAGNLGQTFAMLEALFGQIYLVIVVAQGVNNYIRAGFGLNPVGSPGTCPADINGDGVLNLNDMIAFQKYYFHGDMRADVNRDGLLTIQDLSQYQGMFNSGCP